MHTRKTKKMAAARYVDISRDDFEGWLDSLSLKWSQKRGTKGVYYIHLSKEVAILVSSSIGYGDTNMGRGKAAIHMRLVSTTTGHILNKKDVGQKYFTRTANWRVNLKKAVDKLKAVYFKSAGFYDAIASIKDREAYRTEILEEIEEAPGWENNRFLSDLHGKVDKGGVLTTKQKAAMSRAVDALINVGDETGEDEEREERLNDLRSLYAQAKRAHDTWTMQFAQSIGEAIKRGRSPSPKQLVILKEKFDRYRIQY